MRKYFLNAFFETVAGSAPARTNPATVSRSYSRVAD